MSMNLADAANRLSEALALENAALARMDLPCVIGLLADKTDAVARFAAAAQHDTAPLVTARATVLAAHRLRKLAEENKRLLERAITAQGRVVGIVRGAALRQGAPGHYRRGGRMSATTTAPIAVRSDA